MAVSAEGGAGIGGGYSALGDGETFTDGQLNFGVGGGFGVAGGYGGSYTMTWDEFFDLLSYGRQTAGGTECPCDMSSHQCDNFKKWQRGQSHQSYWSE